jgi:hypothetical protein
MTYKATKRIDGYYIIHDADIFYEYVHEYDPNSGPGIRDRDWEPPNPPLPIERHVFDEKWMREAIRVSEFFPIYFGKEIVGHGQKLRVSGSTGRVTLIADLVVNASTYERIANGELPFRSVEINDPKIPKISGLALLGGFVPFSRLPLLTVNA